MTKKKDLDQEDKITWEEYIKNPSDIYDKDKDYSKENQRKERFKYDLHGYTLEDANKQITEFIENCYVNKVKKVNVITGKGMRSKNLEDPYQSKDLSILKYSVPEYIKNNSELMNKIIKIDFDSVNSPSKGNFDIYLKTIK